ncbi:MAG: hypothetical protein ACYCY6_00260 [Minisyncoccota bacterium]
MTGNSTLKDIVNILLDLINPLLLVLAGLSLLVFFKGLVTFIFNSGDVKANAEGKELMKWGIIALFVMVSLWGILAFLSGSFGFGGVGFPLLPGGIR